MDSVTFKTRQQFLNEFYSRDRVDFLSALRYIAVGDFSLHNRSSNDVFYIDTEATFKKPYFNSHIPFENYHKFLKPFAYFLYSYTRQEKFLKDFILNFNHLKIGYDNNDGQVCSVMIYPTYKDLNFLNKIIINDFIKGINKLYIKILTFYRNINNEQYIILGGIFEEPIQIQEDYETEEENIINSSQCFKSDECVICLTNPPNVLFCNCGHICFCLECEKLKNSNRCPICKIENKIIRYLK